MEFDSPPDSAYTTSTNPERFAAVIDYARDVVDELMALFVVERSDGEWEVDFPRLVDLADGPTIRLTPVTGVPLVLGFTTFPGVAMRIGPNVELAFPHCGCDACDEQVDELCEELRLHVDAVTSGGFHEELRRRWHRYEFTHPDGQQGSSESRLRRGEPRPPGERGRWKWEPWRRSPSC